MTYEEELKLKIYDAEQKKFSNTQGLQWKFNIAVWSLMALCIKYVSSPSVKIGIDDGWFKALLFFWLIFHLTYVVLIQNSLQSSKNICNPIRREASLTEDEKNWIGKILHKRTFWLWVLFQIGITVILAVVLWCTKI